MVRCKMVCNEVSQQHHGPKSQWKYGFNAVYGTSDENKKFWQATPSGTLQFQCMSDGAHPLFKAGDEYYVDISAAAKPEPVVDRIAEQLPPPPAAA